MDDPGSSLIQPGASRETVYSSPRCFFRLRRIEYLSQNGADSALRDARDFRKCLRRRGRLRGRTEKEWSIVGINYHPQSGWFDEGPSKGPPPCGRGLKPPEVLLLLVFFLFLLVADVVPNNGLV